jgi:hypothetical protein
MLCHEVMWQVAGASIDFFHALLMATWVVGLPLLFFHRWPRATRAYGIFAITFIALNQLSALVLGECFLTSIARFFWQHPSTWGSPSAPSDEWFTVRLSSFIFHLSPSHRSITRVSEALILVTAAGVLLSLHRVGVRDRAPHVGSLPRIVSRNVGARR